MLTTGTSTVTIPDMVKNLLFADQLDICIDINSPNSGYLTLTGVVLDVQPCAGAASGIEGTWTGTFQCTNYGATDFGGDISLTVKNTGGNRYEYVDDSGAKYEGYACGNRFQFKGGAPGVFDEYGILTFNGNDAVKFSNWRDITGQAVRGGLCTDTLKKS